MTDRSVGPRATKSAGSAYVLFFVCLVLVLTAGVGMQMASLTIGLLGTEVLLILLPAVIYVRLKRLPVAEGLRWRRVGAGLLLRCALLGPLAGGIAAALSVLVGWLLKPLLGSAPEASLPLNTWSGFGLGLLVGALFAGACEETLFRGAIQGTVERRGAVHAVVVTALLFAVFHLNPWNLLSAAGLGVLLGIVTVRTGSTLPAMVCHACSNATACTFAFAFGHRLDEHQAELVVLGIGGVSAVLFAGVIVEFLRRTAGSQPRPSPLIAAPAGLSRRFLRIAGVTLVVALVLFIIAFRTFFGFHPMTTDSLEPDVHRGDRVLVLKNRFFDVKISPGDVVSFRREGRLFLRKVARADDENVWVIERSAENATSETLIPRSDVTGKMIYRIERGW